MIRAVMSIVSNSQHRNDSSRQIVVVSAFHAVTNSLCSLVRQAARGESNYEVEVTEIENRHLNAVSALIPVANRSSVTAQVKVWCNELRELLHGIFLVREGSLKSLDHVMSFGERLCAFIVAQAINCSGIPCEYLDLRPLIQTDNRFGSARVNFQETYRRLQSHFFESNVLLIATGFIGSTVSGETTTLGRGGSDYTAAIVGAAIGASVVEIWTDVDGVLTADPRKVPKAFPLDQITYEEAMELSHFGAKVIYPPTLQPARELNIPIRILNTFNPQSPGTLIANRRNPSGRVITGISSIDSIAGLRLQGSGMVGVAGMAMRLFGALAKKEISIILITQASSEYTISLAIAPHDAGAARNAIEEEFAMEIAAKIIDEPIVEENLAIVSVIGEEMSNRPGIAGSVFAALGRNGVNVISIAQGSSELNISTVVKAHDVEKAMNAIHDEFFSVPLERSLSKSDQAGKHRLKTLNVFLVGTGLIGKTLVQQIDAHAKALAESHAIEVRLCGIANSRKMLFHRDGFTYDSAISSLEATNTNFSPAVFVDRIADLNLSNCILIDCTASESIPDYYEALLESHVNVVTPNKRVQAGPAERFRGAKTAAARTGAAFLYETSVGAGLPIIGTLNDLMRSGDRIQRIEAVLSGTLSFIFNSFSTERSFSSVVREAKERGYTEPDPRDDLSGVDVMRKLLILARESGSWLNAEDVEVENLVPSEYRSLAVEPFMSRLVELDPLFEKRARELAAVGRKLCYIAELRDGRGKVQLTDIGTDHPFFSLSGSDNIISFTTERYQKRPLVVKGPGAGAEVTAAGVFADIVRIANYATINRGA